MDYTIIIVTGLVCITVLSAVRMVLDYAENKEHTARRAELLRNQAAVREVRDKGPEDKTSTDMLDAFNYAMEYYGGIDDEQRQVEK